MNPALVLDGPSLLSMSTVQNFLRFTAPVSGSRKSREGFLRAMLDTVLVRTGRAGPLPPHRSGERLLQEEVARGLLARHLSLPLLAVHELARGHGLRGVRGGLVRHRRARPEDAAPVPREAVAAEGRVHAARLRDHRVAMIGIAGGAFALTIVLFMALPAQFFPDTNGEITQVKIEMVPGTTIQLQPLPG